MSNLQKYHVSENLYNPYTVEKGRLDSGEVTGSTDVTIDNTTHNSITFSVTLQYRGVITDYIPIPNNVTRLMFSFVKSGVNTGVKAAFYDDEKTWLSDVDGSITSTTMGFTPPTNSVYMRLVITTQTTGSATISNMMLNYGSVAKPFEPYSDDVWHDLAPTRYENGVFVDTADNPEKYQNGSWS